MKILKKTKRKRAIKNFIPVLIDKTEHLEYEFESFLRKTLNYSLTSLLHITPKDWGTRIFSRSSKDGHTVKRNATTHRALEVVYNFDKNLPKKDILKTGILTYTWQHLLNSKALRNRLKLVKEQLRSAIFSFSEEKEINILSLGAGSARAIIETLSEFKNSDLKIKALLLDKSEDSMVYGREMAKKYGVEENLIWVQGNVFDAKEHCDKFNFRPHIVEMVGLLDYFNKKKSVKLFNITYELLRSKGIFISCNIKENRETKFLTNILGWPMIYKDEKYIEDILLDSLYTKSKIIYEPLGVHGFIVCKK